MTKRKQPTLAERREFLKEFLRNGTITVEIDGGELEQEIGEEGREEMVRISREAGSTNRARGWAKEVLRSHGLGGNPRLIRAVGKVTAALFNLKRDYSEAVQEAATDEYINHGDWYINDAFLESIVAVERLEGATGLVMEMQNEVRFATWLAMVSHHPSDFLACIAQVRLVNPRLADTRVAEGYIGWRTVNVGDGDYGSKYTMEYRFQAGDARETSHRAEIQLPQSIEAVNDERHSEPILFHDFVRRLVGDPNRSFDNYTPSLAQFLVRAGVEWTEE